MPFSKSARFQSVFPAAVKQDFATASSYERLLLRGCTEKNIWQLAEQEYLYETGENDNFDKRTAELKSLTGRFESWARRLRKIASEIDEEGSKRLKIEGYQTVSEAIFEVPREVPRYNRTLEQGRDSLVLPAESHRLREAADDFEAASQVKSWQHANRRISPVGFFTVLFWLYSCHGRLDGEVGKSRLEEDAGGLLAKAHEIAGRKNSADPGPWLRMRVTRFQKNAPGEYSKLEGFINNYVRTTRTGEPTLMTVITLSNLLSEQKSRQK